MGRITHYEACPKCRANGNDSRGDNLAVYDDGGKHCFACKHHVFPTYYIPKKVENNVEKSVLPPDFSRDVPARALKWLLQYNLPYNYWRECIGYSENQQRLVFRVGDCSPVGGTLQRNQQPLAFSIGRYVGDDVQQRKWFVWGNSHRHTEALGEGQSIVLVEDLISAHKVASSHAAVAVPLFGTKIHPCHLYYLINEKKPVVLWLDKDQELYVKKQAWQLESVINQKVSVAITDNDPKHLSFEEIKKVINENC